MSRIGKQPVPLPEGVTAVYKDAVIEVKGPKGTLRRSLPSEMQVEIVDGEVRVSRPSDAKRHRAFHGLVRNLIANMVQGVSKGFTRVLEINGVGWAYAPAMVDLDGDGWLDLYSTTGFMSFDREKPDG